MGIGIVLLFWIVVLLGLGKLSAVIFRTLTRKLTIGVGEGRNEAIKSAGRFPSICLIWLAMVFVFQGYVNTSVFHSDIGLGDSWETRLPNGYALLLIDIPDNGTVYNPKTQPGPGIAGDMDDAIGSVGRLQLAGRYIVGSIEERQFAPSVAGPPSRYFLLDTKMGKHKDFADENALRQALRPLGIKLALELTGEVYSRYRYTWFDAFAEGLLLLPPAIGFLLLALWIIRLRRTRFVTEALA